MVEFADIEATRNGLGSAGPLAQSVLSGNSMTAFQSLSSEAVKCLSTARPSRPVVGQMIFETDTKLSYFWDGSAWVNAASPPIGAAGGMLSGTYPNPSVASISGLAAGGNLTGTYPNPTVATLSNTPIHNSNTTISFRTSGVERAELTANGRLIADHFWTSSTHRAAFPSGVNQATTVPISVPFRSSVTFIGSASCFVSGAGGPHRGYMAVYGVTGWIEVSYYYHNTAYDHRTYPTGGITVTLDPGTYNVGWYFPTGQNTDGNDQFGCAAFGKAVY